MIERFEFIDGDNTYAELGIQNDPYTKALNIPIEQWIHQSHYCEAGEVPTWWELTHMN